MAEGAKKEEAPPPKQPGGQSEIARVERLAKDLGKAEALRREEADRADRLQLIVDDQAEVIKGMGAEIDRLRRELQRAQQPHPMQQQPPPWGPHRPPPRLRPNPHHPQHPHPYAIPGPRLTPRPGHQHGRRPY